MLKWLVDNEFTMSGGFVDKKRIRNCTRWNNEIVQEKAQICKWVTTPKIIFPQVAYINRYVLVGVKTCLCQEPKAKTYDHLNFSSYS